MRSLVHGRSEVYEGGSAIRVGVLTYHDGINYGAFFQTLALQNFFLSQGHACEIINYKSKGFTRRENSIFINYKHPIDTFRNLGKINKFKLARKEFHLSKRLFTKKDVEALVYDLVVIGSDEVWNWNNPLVGQDPVYFAEGLQAARIISYGASFGNTKPGQAIPDRFKTALGRIEHISVRDENSALVIKGNFHKEAPVVLDPTFLFDFKSKAVIPSEKGYILVYGIEFHPSVVKELRQFAGKMSLKLISVGYYLPWCDESLVHLGPFEWLGYFLNCRYVITMMYHGLLFSLLCRKDFIMLDTPERRNKIGSLLDDLGLGPRLVSADHFDASLLGSNIDHQGVARSIECKRESSFAFIKKALT